MDKTYLLVIVDKIVKSILLQNYGKCAIIATTAGRVFFSQAEKNQKAKRHGEKLYGEDGRAAAGAAELAALRHCRSETPQLCSRLAGFSQGACHPDGNSEMKLAHKTSLGPLSGSHRAMKHR